MEQKELTVELAFENIKKVIDFHFVGKKEEHIFLQKCVELVEKELKKEEVAE